MNKLMAAGSLFLQKMDVTDLALLKLASCSAGVLLGLRAAKKGKGVVRALAAVTLGATFLPLAGKFILTLTDGGEA